MTEERRLETRRRGFMGAVEVSSVGLPEGVLALSGVEAAPKN